MQRAPIFRLILVLAALCAAAAVAFAAGGADRAAFLWLNQAAAQWLPAAAPSCLTILGHGLVAVMVLAPLLPRAPGVLAAGLCAAPVAGIFSWAGKRLAAVPRPGAVLDPALFHVQGPFLAGHNSFPSGHAITIFLVATVLLLDAAPVRARAAGAVAVLVLAFLAASSRIMVGAHWPSDAFGGAALGVLAGVAGSWASMRWRWWQGPRARDMLAGIVLACAGALAWADTGYPLAEPLQWAAAALGAAIACATLLRARTAAPSP